MDEQETNVHEVRSGIIVCKGGLFGRLLLLQIRSMFANTDKTLRRWDVQVPTTKPLSSKLSVFDLNKGSEWG